MGTSRVAGANLLRFLTEVRTRGTEEALRALHLEQLAGRPLEEIFIGLADHVCPHAGTVDEGIALDAFIETVADLAALGVDDLDSLTADQMQTVFELFATHAIETRIFNDIGPRGIALPRDAHAAAQVQAQLRDFVRRGVADALSIAQSRFETLTPERTTEFVDYVYETAFELLQALGDSEATAV